MTEQTHSADDPRWGQEGRDRKAEAILATLELRCRCDLTHGLWLDVGCGSGGVAATLAAHVEQVVGVDPEPWGRWQAFRDEHPNLVFHAGSYRDLEGLLGAESVDVVVCNQVYEHVDDPAALLKAIHRVLKPTGVCYFAGPNLLWPIEPHVFWPFVHWLPRRFAQRWMSRLGSNRAADLDAWSWSYGRLARAFRKAGFCHHAAVCEHMHVRAMHDGSVAARALAHLPRELYGVLLPLVPGFVFVLHKNDVEGT